MSEQDTYYRREDVPDMSDPQVAMAMYRQQREALPAIELAARRLEDIYAVVERAWQVAGEVGMADVQQGLVTAWEEVRALYETTQAYDHTLAGADAALAAIEAQRANAVAELEALVNSIVERDYSHPVVQELVSSVEEEVYENYHCDLENEIEGSLVDDAVCKIQRLAESMDVTLKYMQAHRVYYMLCGWEKPTEAELEALKQLFKAVAAE